MHKQYLQSNAFRWTLELAGSPKRLLVNIVIFILMGIGSISSNNNTTFFILSFTGIVSCILNYCLYSLARVSIDKASGKGLAPVLRAQRIKLFFWIDTVLILTLSALIVTNVLTSSVFKAVACPLLPTIQLLGIRGLLIFYLT